MRAKILKLLQFYLKLLYLPILQWRKHLLYLQVVRRINCHTFCVVFWSYPNCCSHGVWVGGGGGGEESSRERLLLPLQDDGTADDSLPTIDLIRRPAERARMAWRTNS